MTTTTALLTRHTWGDCPVCGGHLETTPSGAVTCREHRSDHYRIEDEMALGAPVRYLTTLPTRLQPGDPQYAAAEARPDSTGRYLREYPQAGDGCHITSTTVDGVTLYVVAHRSQFTLVRR